MPINPKFAMGGILFLALGCSDPSSDTPPLLHDLELVKLEKKPMLLVFTGDTCVVNPKPNEQRFELQKGSRHGLIIRDYTATLRLNTPAHRDKLIQVEENGTFSLPFGQRNPDRLFTFTAVDEKGGIVIEYNGPDKAVQRFGLEAPPK